MGFAMGEKREDFVGGFEEYCFLERESDEIRVFIDGDLLRG